MINVTRSFLPPREEYEQYLDRIWESHWLTNNGPLVKELESKLKEYLGVQFLQFTSNGTIAIQIALKALGIKGKVITTPFSYVATTSTILWEGCEPVFVDIDPQTLCIDPELVEQAIDEDTQAVLATHVYGLPCDVVRLEAIGRKYGIKIIYDAAHAFGCRYKGRSLLDYGDVATCSFHATKVFHTVEGGCVITHDEALDREVALKKSFGHIGDEHFTLGINGKNSEFHAAMGLAVLPHMQEIIAERKRITETYDQLLQGLPVWRPALPEGLEYNYAYYPVLFENEDTLLKVVEALKQYEIIPRRYFWPSLDDLPYLKTNINCFTSEDISSRILCLPFYNGITIDIQTRIIKIISICLNHNWI
jgi:dTDP-4-amino-4,6-dideoxygalactose transaminase